MSYSKPTRAPVYGEGDPRGKVKSLWRESTLKQVVDNALGFEYGPGDRVIREEDSREFQIEDTLTLSTLLAGRGYKLQEPGPDQNLEVEIDYVSEEEITGVDE